MRLAGAALAELNEKVYRVCVRPLHETGALFDQGYGEENREKIRVLFPFSASVHERDLLTFQGKKYLCLRVRAYPGHVQADFVRRAV